VHPVRTYQKKNQILIAWLLSYASVLIVPLIISILLYIISGIAIESKINKVNEASMMHLRQIVDDNLLSLRNISINIGWDSQVNDIARERQISSVKHHHILVSIINNIKLQAASNKLIDFLYIYFMNSNTVLSNSAKPSY
jgi:hypothetical protein